MTAELFPWVENCIIGGLIMPCFFFLSNPWIQGPDKGIGQQTRILTGKETISHLEEYPFAYIFSN